MIKFKIQYKSVALLIILLLFLKGLVSSIYYLGTNDFMDIDGFRIIGEVKFNYLNITLQILFIFFTIMSFIKREEIDYKKLLITTFSIVMIFQYASFFSDKTSGKNKHSSSVYLENYPNEIDELIEQEFDLKSTKLKNIEVLHPYMKVTNGDGIVVFDGVNYSMYRVFIDVSNLKNPEEVYDENYTMMIDTNFNLMFNHLNEDYTPIENKPKEWKFETLKKNFDFL